MNLYFFASLFFVTSFASAAEQSIEGAEKSVDEIVELEFSKEFCQKITTEHRPQNDVMYQAGIDAEGEAVVPADLNAFSVPIPKKIVIPLTIHKQYSLKTQSSGTVTTPEGKVVIPEGKVTLPEGKVTTPPATVLPPGTVLPGGELTLPPGTVLPAGTVTPLGKVLLPEGKVIIPEGKVTLPEGKVTLPEGQIKQSGTGEFVPKGHIKSPYVNEIPLGFVEYELESGKMTYNGKTFSSQQEALLRQKCQDVLEKSEN